MLLIILALVDINQKVSALKIYTLKCTKTQNIHNKYIKYHVLVSAMRKNKAELRGQSHHFQVRGSISHSSQSRTLRGEDV